ncbi:MAG: Na+/H+ antiporter subunit E [Methanoculleaceae archaeon]
MIPFLATFTAVYIAYLALTAGSGSTGLWSATELITGIFLAAIVAFISRRFFCRTGRYRMANPLRLVLLFVYAVLPFFIEMAVANLDVAYRVLTGRIRPGIIRLDHDLETDLGIMLLANSITLTPGTLTVDVDEETGDLFVHKINIPPGLEEKVEWSERDIFTLFPLASWVRRIAE